MMEKSSPRPSLVEDNAADVDLTRETLASSKFDIKLSVAKDGVEAIDFLSGAANWSEAGSIRPSSCSISICRGRMAARSSAVLKGQDEFTAYTGRSFCLRRIPNSDITSCYNLGANCYMVKPIDLQAYRELVRTLEGFWLGAAKLPQHEGHSIATGIGYAN